MLVQKTIIAPYHRPSLFIGGSTCFAFLAKCAHMANDIFTLSTKVVLTQPQMGSPCLSQVPAMMPARFHSKVSLHLSSLPAVCSSYGCQVCVEKDSLSDRPWTVCSRGQSSPMFQCMPCWKTTGQSQCPSTHSDFRSLFFVLCTKKHKLHKRFLHGFYINHFTQSICLSDVGLCRSQKASISINSPGYLNCTTCNPALSNFSCWGLASILCGWKRSDILEILTGFKVQDLIECALEFAWISPLCIDGRTGTHRACT